MEVAGAIQGDASRVAESGTCAADRSAAVSPGPAAFAVVRDAPGWPFDIAKFTASTRDSMTAHVPQAIRCLRTAFAPPHAATELLDSSTGGATHESRAPCSQTSLTGKMKKAYAARNRRRGGGYRQVLCRSRSNAHNATRGIDDRAPAVPWTNRCTNANQLTRRPFDTPCLHRPHSVRVSGNRDGVVDMQRAQRYRVNWDVIGKVLPRDDDPDVCGFYAHWGTRNHAPVGETNRRSARSAAL